MYCSEDIVYLFDPVVFGWIRILIDSASNLSCIFGKDDMSFFPHNNLFKIPTQMGDYSCDCVELSFKQRRGKWTNSPI